MHNLNARNRIASSGDANGYVLTELGKRRTHPEGKLGKNFVPEAFAAALGYMGKAVSWILSAMLSALCKKTCDSRGLVGSVLFTGPEF